MNTPLKYTLQLLGMSAILGTSACVVDPYYSGVDYGYDLYDSGSRYTSTTTVFGTGSNFAFNSGFLVGDYYYLNNRYYPVSYYQSGGNRYYRPIFDRPLNVHPDSRYRNLSRAQLEQWRRNQNVRFDPSFRPNNNKQPQWQNRPQTQTNKPHVVPARPNQWQAQNPSNNRPNGQWQPNRPNWQQQQQRPQVQQRPQAQQRPQIQRPGQTPQQQTRPQSQVRPQPQAVKNDQRAAYRSNNYAQPIANPLGNRRLNER